MVSKANAEHYTWGEQCDGWHLVKTPGLSVIHERMPPHTHETRHYHNTAHQFFFVLEGVATLEVNGVRHTLGAQEGLEVPPHRLHQMFNESDQAVEFLVISQPPSHGDRIAAESPSSHKPAEQD